MRTLTYFFIGILFGITLFKSEAASWFRIYEMFQFKSFHMYGIIGSALVLGVIITQSIKRFKLKSFYNNKGMNNLGWKQIMSIVRSLIDLGGAINKGNNWVCYELNKTIIRQQLN